MDLGPKIRDNLLFEVRVPLVDKVPLSGTPWIQDAEIGAHPSPTNLYTAENVRKISPKIQALADQIIAQGPGADFMSYLTNLVDVQQWYIALAAIIAIGQGRFEDMYGIAVVTYRKMQMYLIKSHSTLFIPLDLLVGAFTNMLDTKEEALVGHILFLLANLQQYAHITTLLFDEYGTWKKIYKVLSSGTGQYNYSRGVDFIKTIPEPAFRLAIKNRIVSILLAESASLNPESIKLLRSPISKYLQSAPAQDAEYVAEVRNALKNTSSNPKLNVLKVDVVMWGLKHNYKKYKSEFQEPEFKTLMEMLKSNDRNEVLDSLKYLEYVSHDAPEKIYDVIGLFKQINHLVFGSFIKKHPETRAPILQGALVIPYALIPEAKTDGSQASKVSMCRDSDCSRETQFFNRPGAVIANPYRNGEDSMKYVFPMLIHLLETQPENEKFTILQVLTYLIHFMRQKYPSVFPQAVKQADVLRTLTAKANERNINPKHLHFYLECALELVENMETRQMLKNSNLLDTIKKQMKASNGPPSDEMEAKFIEKTSEVFAYIENVLSK